MLCAVPLIAQQVTAQEDGNAGPATADIVVERCVDDGVNSSNLEGGDFTTKSDEYLVSMRLRLSNSLALLRKAREDKDAIRLTCVNEKVAKIKGLLRVAENANVALQEAQANQDLERTRYEFDKIRAAWLRMCDLYNAAANCIGVGAPYVGEGSITFQDNGGVEWDPYFGSPSIFFEPGQDFTGGLNTIGPQQPPVVVSVYRENN